MEERSLRITGADTSFINKITNTLTKLLIPTKIGINGFLISIKRTNILKAYEEVKKKHLEWSKRFEGKDVEETIRKEFEKDN